MLRTLPLGLGVWAGAFHTAGWVGTRLEWLLQLPLSVPFFHFFFLRNSSCSILPAPYKEGPVLSHSPPLQLDWGLSRSGHVSAQPSTLRSRCTRSPWVYHFVLIPLPVTPRHQVSWCCSNLVWQGALNPESKSP